ncbi:hypothetical protein PMAYCL1PPCAC_23991 [Pristionchus mayeri]|uniref:Nuclear pore complex protein Nup153 n=1 Tax=Pristionchus mayeri TaxID=1317129 RepID=A0AAN5CZ51_9BILA|nr:hypothetical protein PMAYCL1PPCAC_23991 [Pristionchus mayeri]
MSSLEKPGFFSKLFGLNVSRPTSSTDSGPSPSSNGSSLSSHDEHATTNGSSPALSKSLRYLSPTAIENSFSRVSTRTVESTSDTARKRPLESPQATSGIANGSFYISDTAKRFRGSMTNTSLMSEPVTRLEIPRLDTMWCAGTGVVSPTNLSYSPCSSVRSLRSRITRPSSRTSVLSSKTAALLGQIEKVSTPAQDARRMPMLRVGLNKERWNTLGSSVNSNPPLNRLSSAPSRYQVMSSFLTPMQKKPYWRDVARERTDEGNEEVGVAAETSSSLPITIRSENGEKNGIKNQEMRAPAHQPVLKGADGSNVNRERNTFSANEIASDDSLDLNALNKVKGLDASQFVFALPSKGFLTKDVKPSFSFKKPVKVSESMAESESSEDSESEEAESSGSDAGSGRDDESDSGRNGGCDAIPKIAEKTSDTSSSAENTSKETSNEESKKNSSPKNTIAASFVPKPVSVAEPPKKESAVLKCSSATWDCPSCYVNNKEVHSKCICCGEAKPGAFAAVATAPTGGANWDCPSCCVNNKAVDVKCVCCGGNRPGVAPPPAASNVFGERAFKPTTAPSGGFSFGFGGGSGSSSTVTFGIKPSTENASIKTSGEVISTESKLSEKTVVSSTPSTASIPSISVAPPVSSALMASKPLFGGSSTPIGTIGSSGAFSFEVKAPPTNGEGEKSVASSLAPSIPLFSSVPSAPTTTSVAAAVPLFGLTSGSRSASSTTVVPSLPSVPLFGPSSLSAAPSISSSSGMTLPTTSAPPIPLFGASSATPSPAPSLNLFGNPSVASRVAPISNDKGSSTPSLTFTFGASGTTKAPLFGTSTDVKPLFGGSKPSDDEGSAAKRSMIGASSSTLTPFTFGGQKGAMGTANLFSSSTSSTPFGGLSQSASTPSFSLPTAPPSSFNFGSDSTSTVPPPSTFNFGGSSSAAPSVSAPFVFGSQSSQPAASSFGMGSFGGAPPPPVAASFAPPDASNPFAFNSSAAPSGSRKMIQAKRRLPGKR